MSCSSVELIMGSYEEKIGTSPNSYFTHQKPNCHSISSSSIYSEYSSQDTVSELPSSKTESGLRNGHENIYSLRETQSLSDIYYNNTGIIIPEEKLKHKSKSISRWLLKRMSRDSYNVDPQRTTSLWNTLRKRRNKSCESLPSVSKIEGQGLKKKMLTNTENLEAMKNLGASCPHVPTEGDDNPSGVSIYMTEDDGKSTSRRSGLRRATSLTSSTSRLLRRSLRAAKNFLRSKTSGSSPAVIQKRMQSSGRLTNNVLEPDFGTSSQELSTKEVIRQKTRSCFDISSSARSPSIKRSSSIEREVRVSLDKEVHAKKSKTLPVIRSIGKKSASLTRGDTKLGGKE